MFSKLALQVSRPSVLLAVRFLATFLIMNLLVAAGLILNRIKGRIIFRFSLRGKPIGSILLMGIFQPVMYFICENYGIAYTSSAFAGTIIALTPVAGVLADVFLMHQRVTGARALCAALSVVGVFLTSIGGEMRATALGLALLLLALAAATLYFIFGKKAAAHYNAFERTYVMFLTGAVFFPLLALIQTRGDFAASVLPALKNGGFWLAVCYLALLSSVVAFLLQNYANTYLAVSESMQFGNVTTAISVLAGVVLLKEPFGAAQLIGAATILACVAVAGRSMHLREN